MDEKIHNLKKEKKKCIEVREMCQVRSIFGVNGKNKIKEIFSNKCSHQHFISHLALAIFRLHFLLFGIFAR